MVYLALEKILNEFAEKEGKEHVDTYNKVALTAKAEGYADVEAMLCAYAEEEAKIAQTAKNVSELLKVKALLNEFAEKEGKEHVDTYNKVALTAKAEGYADVEAMLCAYAEEEAKIAQTAKNVSELLKVKALLSEFAEKEGKEHVDTYNKVALTAKAEGYADVEAMLCAYAEEEAKIAQTAKNVAA